MNQFLCVEPSHRTKIIFLFFNGKNVKKRTLKRNSCSTLVFDAQRFFRYFFEAAVSGFGVKENPKIYFFQ